MPISCLAARPPARECFLACLISAAQPLSSCRAPLVADARYRRSALKQSGHAACSSNTEVRCDGVRVDYGDLGEPGIALRQEAPPTDARLISVPPDEQSSPPTGTGFVYYAWRLSPAHEHDYMIRSRALMMPPAAKRDAAARRLIHDAQAIGAPQL